MNDSDHDKKVMRIKRFTMVESIHHLKVGLLRDERGVIHHVVEVGKVRRLIGYLDRFKRRLIAVASGNAPAWTAEGLRGRIVMSKEARELWYSIRDVEESAPEHFVEERRLDPWLALGLDLAREWRPRLIHCTGLNGQLLGCDEVARDGMVEIFQTIRKECRRKDFRRDVKNLARGARDNFFRCARYLLSLLAEHARPLILRIDLYFEGDAKQESDSAAAKKAFDKFIRALREERIIPDVLRYITKREDGLERRIHYHVLIAMDGDKHRDVFTFSERVGRYWVDECVGSSSLASYFNVWLRRRELEYCCLGHLHYLDEHMLEGLRRCIWYLCEDGSHVLVNKGRNLRRGQMPKGARAHKRGRPRADGTSLTIAERILFKPPPAAKERIVVSEPDRASASSYGSM